MYSARSTHTRIPLREDGEEDCRTPCPATAAAAATARLEVVAAVSAAEEGLHQPDGPGLSHAQAQQAAREEDSVAHHKHRLGFDSSFVVGWRGAV